MSAKKQPVVHTYDVAGAVSDGYSELQCLGEEMRNWYDNMPENFQNADKGSQVSEAADTLESLNEPDAPEVVANLDCSFTSPPSKAKSRAARRDDAVNLLEVAKSAVDDWMGENEGHKDFDEVSSFADELESLIDEASAVEFPGMY